MGNLNDKPLKTLKNKSASYEYEYKKIEAELEKIISEKVGMDGKGGLSSLLRTCRWYGQYYYLVLKIKYFSKKIEEFKYQRYNLGYSELLYRCLAEYNTIKSPAPPYLYLPLVLLGYMVIVLTLFDIWQLASPLTELISNHEMKITTITTIGRRLALEIICILAIILNLKKMQKNKKLFIKKTNEANENIYIMLKKEDISVVQFISEEIRYQQSNVNLKLSDKMLVIVTAFSGLAAVVTLSSMLPFIVNWMSGQAGNIDKSVIIVGLLISFLSLLPLLGAKSSLNKQLSRLMGIVYTIQIESRAKN